MYFCLCNFNLCSPTFDSTKDMLQLIESNFFSVWRFLVDLYAKIRKFSPSQFTVKNIVFTSMQTDADFILDGSSISFEETINMLNIFTKLSGLNINYDKSEVIWIGSCRNSSVRYLRILN